MPELKNSKLNHVAMFPWLAMGHITPFIHLANELAVRGHSVSILIPRKAMLQLGHHNHHSHLIKFILLTVPHVDGLPLGMETASDVDDPAACSHLIDLAFDSMSKQVENILYCLKPDIVFYDFACWIPKLAVKIGFRTVFYSVICASYFAYGIVPARSYPEGRLMSEEELMEPPQGYPSPAVALRRHEARTLFLTSQKHNFKIFDGRFVAALQDCDAIAIRTCRELEGPMCDYLSQQYSKKVLLSGPILPEAPKGQLEEKWDTWLSKFERSSVVYCAFGSQTVLQKDQFQELVLGLEATGLPFLVAVPKPQGAESIEEALPEGFVERVGERGVVYGGWVKQTHILKHPSVGCFVSHCGFGSMWESLLSDNQIVLVPNLCDQMLDARLLVAELKVAVEVERGEMGWFSKEDLSKAVRSVMDEESEVGKMVKKKHAEWKEGLMTSGVMDNYMDKFVQQLYQLYC